MRLWWPSLGRGIVWLILTPIVCLILMITIIGLPLGIIGLVMYFVVLYMVKVVASYAVGYQVLKWLGAQRAKDGWVLLLGLVVFMILVAIPFIGWIIKCLLIIWALGALVEFKKEELKKYR